MIKQKRKSYYYNREQSNEMLRVSFGYWFVNLIISGCVFMILGVALQTQSTTSSRSSSVVLTLTAIQLLVHALFFLWQGYEEFQKRRRHYQSKATDFSNS
jgi:heme/copper-type cytochrome/quinol oxidase subunit 4